MEIPVSHAKHRPMEQGPEQGHIREAYIGILLGPRKAHNNSLWKNQDYWLRYSFTLCLKGML